MAVATVQKRQLAEPKNQLAYLGRRILYHWQIYVLLLPGLIYFAVFKLAPLWGLQIAFQDFNPYNRAKSVFVGFKYFQEFFQSPVFLTMLRNTLVLNLINLVFYFPMPIIIAIALSEIRFPKYKRLTQSLVYLPHFLSWVVVASFTFFILSYDQGIVNKILLASTGERYTFLSNPNLFWGILVSQTVWRETGWGTILFLAAISNINPELYQAAAIDGASRFRQVMSVTLPGMAPTIVVMLVLRLGQSFDVQLEQVLLMQNSLVLSVGEVFDTYAFTQGVQRANFSIGASVGLFKGFVNMLMVIGSNALVKKFGHDGLY